MAINGQCIWPWLSSPPLPIKAHLELYSCPFALPSCLPHPPLASCAPPPERFATTPLLAARASLRRWGVPNHLFLTLLRTQSSPELSFIPGPPLPRRTRARRHRLLPPVAGVDLRHHCLAASVCFTLSITAR
jgi:hypothetical protein